MARVMEEKEEKQFFVAEKILRKRCSFFFLFLSLWSRIRTTNLPSLFLFAQESSTSPFLPCSSSVSQSGSFSFYPVIDCFSSSPHLRRVLDSGMRETQERAIEVKPVSLSLSSLT